MYEPIHITLPKPAILHRYVFKTIHNIVHISVNFDDLAFTNLTMEELCKAFLDTFFASQFNWSWAVIEFLRDFAEV